MTQVDPAFYAAGIVLPGPTSAANATGQIPVWNSTGWDAWLGTWDGTYLILPALAVTDLTATRIPYASTSGRLADNANLVWDNTNSRLGVGVASPAAAIHVIKTTEQLRLGYDASNYVSAVVDSSGNVGQTSTGGATSIATVNNKFRIVAGTTSQLEIGYATSSLSSLYSTSAGALFITAYNGLTTFSGTSTCTLSVSAPSSYAELSMTGVGTNYFTSNAELQFYVNSGTRLTISTAGTVSGAAGISAGAVTFAVLDASTPTATLGVRRITDRGNKLAYPDGTNWRFVGDDAIIS